MSRNILSSAEKVTPLIRPAFFWTLADAFVVAKRQIIQIPRIPDELMTSMFQPAITVLLFRYMFGGAITIPGTSYVNYLMAGVFVQSLYSALPQSELE